VHTSTSFCHQNHFFVFRNEHSQSTTLGPKLMFGVVSRNFVAARHHSENGCRGAYKHEFLPPDQFLHFWQRTCPILGPKLMFGVVSRNFVAARHPFRKRVSGCIRSMSFCHRNHYFFFRKKNMPNPLLWVQNSCLAWFRAISLPHVTHSKNGCRGAYKA
jgi:hypothetical protein